MKDLKLTLSSIGYVIKTLTDIIMGDQGKTYRVSIKEWREKRSLNANAQCHVWFPIIAEHIGSDAKTVKARAKIDFGLPILLNSDDEYSNVLRYVIDKTNFYQMSYEQQEKMIQGVAITSKMSTPECNRFRDNIQSYWNQHGLILEYKNNE